MRVILNPLSIWLRPKTKLSRLEIARLKIAIKQRLRTEDYTRRIPRPRVRYKLKTVVHKRSFMSKLPPKVTWQ